MAWRRPSSSGDWDRMSLEIDQTFVATQLDRLLQSGVRGLSFPAVLERQFERDRGAQRAQRLWREGLISIIVFNLFYVGEWLITRQVTLHELLTQLGIITPLSLVVNFTMLLNPPRWLREGSVAGMTCGISCTYLYLQHGKEPIAIAFTLVGVIVTAMFASVVMRLRFYFALAATSVIVVAGQIFLVVDHGLTADQKTTGAALMTIAIGISMMSNYSLEREERVGYLRYLESEAQRYAVSEMNLQLAKLSSMDKLTGLANRRAYEERFDQLWSEAIEEGSSLAAVVIDVDHFKVLNDLRGHIYGDEVLSKVGLLLPKALRSTADFAARYGGEEFVVLLPRTEQDAAVRIAERIRALIEMAGSPPQPPLPVSECLMWVTASCGVSACVPRSEQKREELLESADRAMYHSKSMGRNRVSYSPCERGGHGAEPRIIVTGIVA